MSDALSSSDINFDDSYDPSRFLQFLKFGTLWPPSVVQVTRQAQTLLKTFSLVQIVSSITGCTFHFITGPVKTVNKAALFKWLRRLIIERDDERLNYSFLTRLCVFVDCFFDTSYQPCKADFAWPFTWVSTSPTRRSFKTLGFTSNVLKTTKR